MKGLVRSLSRARGQSGIILKPRYVVRAQSITVTDPGSANAPFTAVIGDLPKGNILLLGAVGYFGFTKVSGGLDAAFAGSISVGTTPTADATLDGTDVNILPATAITTASAGVSARKRYAASTAAIFDNTDNSLEINLNGFLTDATMTATGIMTVTGELQLLISALLDD